MQFPLDKKLELANDMAMTSGQMTPLIKEELWSLIQSRRLSEGKEELQVEFKPPDKGKLTPEEEEKAKRRKEKNRVAARKCRSKKKMLNETIEDTKKELMDRNTFLKKKLEELEAEKAEILCKLREFSIPSPAPSTSSSFCQPPSPFSICTSPPPYSLVGSPTPENGENSKCSFLNAEEQDPEVSNYLDGEQQVVPSAFYQEPLPEPFNAWNFFLSE